MAPPRDARRLVPAFALMIAVGPSNYVLYKILFAAYGEASAFFVMQGINLLYCVYGGLALWQVSGEITPCLLYTSPSPRDKRQSRMPSSA